MEYGWQKMAICQSLGLSNRLVLLYAVYEHDLSNFLELMKRDGRLAAPLLQCRG